MERQTPHLPDRTSALINYCALRVQGHEFVDDVYGPRWEWRSRAAAPLSFDDYYAILMRGEA